MESQLGELVNRPAILERQRARTAEILDHRSILPGVMQFIEQARSRNMRLAVTSGSHRGWVEQHLQRLELRQHFDVIRCADDVEHLKPDPALHLAVVSALEVPAQDAIAIEDSPRGIEAAKAAGLYCVSVPNALTRSLSMDEADLALLSLAATSLDEIVVRANRRRAAPES
jgi:putative hydrolase of the HAD superfamily